jgi:sorting nexin-9/18/33
LADALLTTGNIYTDISNSYGEQAKNDINPLLDQMQLYRCMLQQMPDIVNLNKSAIVAVEEAQARPERQDMQQLNDAMSRLNVVNYATLAEINFFHTQKLTDLNAYTKEFLNKQILFYSEVSSFLKIKFN